MKLYTDLYEQIISLDNLFLAWKEFRGDKQYKPDVMKYEYQLEENIFSLHRSLRAQRYKHGAYEAFYIQDPKQRLIHKATVQDRVLHHAIYNILNPIFEPTFIAHSYSCRIGKGTHKGVANLANMLRKVSKNNTSSCFALKCDIRKFFASVDQDILLSILERRIQDTATLNLLKQIIYSFDKQLPGKGIPIGNLTSQLFANLYMNEFDQFVKHELRVKYYLRYTDDFVIISDNTGYLESLLPKISQFLETKLALEMHPNKVSILKYRQGIDFLGYVILPHHIRLRTKTKRRMLRKLDQNIIDYKAEVIDKKAFNQSLQSYLGVLSHADSHEFTQDLVNKIWFELSDQ